MKKATLLVTAFACMALYAGIASAQKTPVAGFSPNLADPQPATSATLTPEANRLIRWQGWLDVDAFSASILEQMQKQLGSGIEVGTFTMEEPAIGEAVRENQGKDGFTMNDNLNVDKGEKLENPKLYVWTYRHNYTDTGLYQLYVSVKGKMLIGKHLDDSDESLPHRDIQSLGYEFGSDGTIKTPVWKDIHAEVEIWRGAVVRVNARGALVLVGNEAGVVVGPLKDEAVEAAPISKWEKAPSLKNNPNYNPEEATGAAYVEPLEREKPVTENAVQKATGSVEKKTGDRWQDAQEQRRVRTNSSFRFRNR